MYPNNILTTVNARTLLYNHYLWRKLSFPQIQTDNIVIRVINAFLLSCFDTTCFLSVG